MRKVLTAAVFLFPGYVLLASSNAAAETLPDLICTENARLVVDPKSLDTSQVTPTRTYRFKSGKLYIGLPENGEYFYNPIVEDSPGRFLSGNKIIHFEGGLDDFETAVFVHVARNEVRVSRATCTSAP